MAAGQFLGDLSSGIFQRQRELQQQQETRDFTQQEGIVRMLAGLVDKVEDPSMLMGHIWDTMGIKKQSSGKGLRGFLDAFSGMPNRTMEDQLGTKFRELTGSFMGAGEAKGIRQRSQVAQKGLPYPGGYAPPTPGPFMDKAKTDQARLDKSIVFRDPYQEKLGTLEAQYKAKGEHDLTMQELRNQASIARIQEQARLREENDRADYERKTTQGIDQVAAFLESSEDVQRFPQEQRKAVARIFAQRLLATEKSAKIEEIYNRMGFRDILGRKAESEMTGQGTRSQKLAQSKFNYQQSGDRRKLEEAIGLAKGEIDTLTSQYEDIGKSLDATAAKMGAGKTRKDILTSQLFSPTSPYLGPTSDAVKEYRNLERKLGEARTSHATKTKALEDFDKEFGPKKAKPPNKPSPKAGLGTAKKRPIASIMISAKNDPAFVNQAKKLGSGKTVINPRDNQPYIIFAIGEDNVILVPAGRQ